MTTARARTAIGVAVFTALAACSSPEPAPRASPATPTTIVNAAVTQVLTFQAFDDTGLLPNLVRSATVAGSCAGGSSVHTGRADAWRCRAGEATLDPCFANATGEELACAPDPWSREVTIVRPATPLGRAGSNRNDPGAPPWFLELADGTRCGRTPPATYRCGTGVMVGDPDPSRPVWTVRPVGAGQVNPEVRTAWY